jgi:putative tryptophan/tyrosine transport system substrate-binding protein
MKRREFITVLGVAAAAWPHAARAQQASIPVVGFLSSASPVAWKPYLDAFRLGLNEAGYVEGRTVAIEYRWAEGQYERLPLLAADLVARNVALLVSTGGTPTALAATAATKTIPIVFTLGADPVKLGLVASLNRPGGNVTGVNLFVSQMEGKRLGLLRELVPAAALIAVLVNPNDQNAATQLKDVQEAAHALGQQIHILHATSDAELDAAFVTVRQVGAGALLVAGDPFFNSRRTYIVALAARHAIPAIYEQREYALAGGLMSYGTNLPDGYHQVGLYAARILKGESPADLPVVQSTKFQFVINLTTAKALGIAVPPMLSARADEVIE